LGISLVATAFFRSNRKFPFLQFRKR